MDQTEEQKTMFRVALAGNPNCGKTTLFNALTGAHQHVGNYPGVTVERRDGTFKIDDAREASLTDLPGTYSLSSFSPEEKVAQDELLSGVHDVVVVVADSGNLQRQLVLMTQVMQMGANIVLCLNMADEAKAAGQVLDLPQMEKLLGVPVVETVGHKREGIDGLKAAIAKAIEHPVKKHRLVLGERLEKVMAEIRPLIPEGFARPEAADWFASRLLIGDRETVERLSGMPKGAEALEKIAALRTKLEAEIGHDAGLAVTEGYFGFVDGLLKEVMTQRSREDAREMTKKIDAVLANRVLGLPIFALVMFLIFQLAFTLGDPPMGWIESGFGALGEWVGGFIEHDLLKSLIVDGIIGGVGGVIVFLPNILLLFLGLAFLEDTGYLARSAFLLDRVMHMFGLHGKSFIPMVTGFGCSVPGIMATRTLENEKDRLTTMFVLPLMSCGARLPIWMLLIPAFFPTKSGGLMLFLIYTIGIVVALLLSLVLRKTVLKGAESPFVMELPPYRLPTLRGILTKMLDRGWMYLKKAGTIILAVTILLWVLAKFPGVDEGKYAVDALVDAGKITVVEDPPEEEAAEADADKDKEKADEAKAAVAEADGKDKAEGGEAEPEKEELPVADRLAKAKAGENVTLTQSELEGVHAEEDLEASYVAKIGKTFAPLFKPMDFDWKMVTAMIGAFAAKEVFVAQMGVVYSMGEVDEESEGLRATLQKNYTPLTGFTLMVFLLISAPCMATIAVTKRESNSWKWALGQLLGLTVLAYVLALLVNLVGKALGF